MKGHENQCKTTSAALLPRIMKKGGLYCFFSPKPKVNDKYTNDENKDVLCDNKIKDIKDKIIENDEIVLKPSKRRRFLEVDEEMEENANENDESIKDISNSIAKQNDSFGSSSILNTPSKKVVDFKKFECSQNMIKIESDFYENKLTTHEDCNNLDEQKYPHMNYQFLKDGFRRDKNGYLHTHPDYDSTTLLLPKGFISSKEITPAMKQWWKIKSENFDTVLFFKMGKFYETFHMDADVSVKELGLIYMKGKYAHAGFPETSFAIHASALVEKGYKVARIEQTERPSEVSNRISVSGISNAEEKLVRRDLCAILSSGTRIFDSFDFEVTTDASYGHNKNVIGFGVLLSVVEDINFFHSYTNSSKSNDKCSNIKLGVCVLDCSTGQFKLAEFIDDKTLSKLRTMLAEYPIPVAEMIIPKASLSKYAYNQLIKINNNARKELINVCYSSQQTIKELLAGGYFQGELYDCVVGDGRNSAEISKDDDSNINMLPIVLREMLVNAKDNSSSNAEYALSALGNCMYLLKRHLIDQRIISMGHFIKYEPIDNCNAGLTDKFVSRSALTQSASSGLSQMILDENSMRNLDIMLNSEGLNNKNSTIFGLLNQSSTPFGRRYMSLIVCHPLYQVKDINARLDAIDELINLGNSEINLIREKLSEIPDLERLLFRLHASKNLYYSSNHPQNKAIIFNEFYFNKKKVEDLISTVSGFDRAFSIFILLSEKMFKSAILKNLLNFQDYLKDSQFNNLIEIQQFFKDFKDSFNIKINKSESIVVPHPGIIPEYDKSLTQINDMEGKLNDYLDNLKNKLKCSNIKYWGSGRSRYLIEIPISYDDKLPDYFELKSQRKGFRRYSSLKVQDMLNQLIVAEENRDKALRDVFALLVKRLIIHKNILLKFIQQVSILDCLISLAFFSMGSITNGQLCRPIISDSSTPYINLKGSYHLSLSTVNPNLVSNDLSLGSTSSDGSYTTTLLITGANMGGKSTLMRQIAITVILAQIGCYVPATYCSLTPFDRIFARLGASFDHPNLGESTFYVELYETLTMINNATDKSLILLDELGRGTSTHDGLSIAYSVLKYITKNIKCLTLFSTHYHFMAKELERDININGNIKMIYMKCLVDDEPNDNQTDDISHITFLYKIAYGICPKSYGFHVAALAGIPNAIITRGMEMARKLERNSLIKELIRDISNYTSVSDICKRLVKI